MSVPEPHTPGISPAGEDFDTLQEAYDACQRMALRRHFAVTRGRTTRSKGANRKYDPKGRVMRQDITCTRGSTNTAAARSKGSRSTKTACPWRAKIVHVKAIDKFRLTVQEDTHNHEIDGGDDWSPANIAAVRRWQRITQPGIVAEIHRLNALGSLSSSKIAAQIRENPSLAGGQGVVHLTAADVANEIRQRRIYLATHPEEESALANPAGTAAAAAAAATGTRDEAAARDSGPAAAGTEDISALNRRIDGIESTLSQLVTLVQQVVARLPPAASPPPPPANGAASHPHDHSATGTGGNPTMGMGFQ